MDAKQFYGSAFTPARESKLNDAFKWLMKAIEFERVEGGERKAEMAFNAALKNEAEAFA